MCFNSELLLRVPCNVSISEIDNLVMYENYCRYRIMAKTSSFVGEYIAVYDYRDEVVNFVKNRGGIVEIEHDLELIELISKKALFSLKKKIKNGTEINYIILNNFFGSKPSALLNYHKFSASLSNNGYEIINDNSMWKFESTSPRRMEKVLLSLTSDEKDMLIRRIGVINNTDCSRINLVSLGSSVQLKQNELKAV